MTFDLRCTRLAKQLNELIKEFEFYLLGHVEKFVPYALAISFIE